jgi:hypothetical protein
VKVGRHALRASFTVEEIFNLTKIDRWFLVQIKEIVDLKEELPGCRTAPKATLLKADVFLSICYQNLSI